MTFEERIGGQIGDYIKVKEIEQTPDGKKYGVIYNNDGLFILRIFGQEKRMLEEIKESEVCINDLLSLNDYTMCNEE